MAVGPHQKAQQDQHNRSQNWDEVCRFQFSSGCSANTAKSEGAGLHPVNYAKFLCRAKLCSGEGVLRVEFKLHRIETPRQRKEKILVRERKRIAGGLAQKI